MQGCDKMKKHFLLTGHAKHNLEEKLPKKEIELCKHLEYCMVRKTFRDKHKYKDCSLEESENCQSAKF